MPPDDDNIAFVPDYRQDTDEDIIIRYRQILIALSMLNIMIIETDEQGRVRFANEPALDFINKHKSADNELRDYLRSFSALTLPLFKEIYDPARNLWLKISSSKSSDFENSFLHIVEDISNWKQHESELKLHATFDELTGVYNRKAGLDFLQELLNDKKADFSHCIAFLDIDDLKAINDKYGHTEGDYALKSVAEVLFSSVRESDAVFRYGGDEFIVIFTRCSEERALFVIERMMKRLTVIDVERPKPFKLRFSYGVVAFNPRDYNTPEELIVLADKKMYHDKIANKLERKASRYNE